MIPTRTFIRLATLFGIFLAVAFSEARAPGQELVRPGYRVVLAQEDHATFEVFAAGSDRAIMRSGVEGLWRATFRDGKHVSAADFHTGAEQRQLSVTMSEDRSAAHLTFDCPELKVIVHAWAGDDGVDLSADVLPCTEPVLEFALPGELRFDPQQLQRFIAPLTPHLGVGAAMNRSFFIAQDTDSPTGWEVTDRGDQGYRALLGQGPTMHDWDAPASPLRVTDAGRTWLGPELARRLAAASARVNRPYQRSQTDLVLLDSDAGPYLAASNLGGAGHLWRVGGRVDQSQVADTLDAVTAIIDTLADAPGTRRRLGLLSLPNGPANGQAAAVTVDAWRRALQRTAEAHSLYFEELRTPQAMAAAAGSGDYLVILNPYGELLPVADGSSIVSTAGAIGRYVQGGGNWWEVGGFSFFAALRPVAYLRFEGEYPPLFADFFHVQTDSGSASVYRVQPRTWQPWDARRNRDAVFVPGRLSFGGDSAGGWCRRAFGIFVPAGQTWTTPRVHVSIDRTPEAAIQQYCLANSITRTLDDKLPPPLRAPFRQAVLLKYVGTAREQIASLDALPVPTLIHITDYLKGGFDKEYPDHLPPAPGYGTAEELRTLFDRAHASGHLMMPYTNPTWWCDHPRGPTFLRAGEAPLLRRLDGQLSHERYGSNDGYTTCLWHPDVQAANRETLRQFTEDYPVDILFQDQCGARTWTYDTNPASPAPYAYAEGMISMVEQDSRVVPLGTEDGFDRIVNSQVQLCGFTFGLVPGQNPDWARSFKQVYPPGTWQLYPLAQQIAHDKVAMLHHDLGKFVVDRRTLSWTLGLGFAMSYRARATDLSDVGRRQWLRWLDRIQKSVVARYVGEPVQGFEHRQPPEISDDDGLIQATYGPVRLAANLGPAPRRDGRWTLAGFGFVAQSPGMLAGNLQAVAGIDFGEQGISFVAEGDENQLDIWIYASGDSDVAVPLPVKTSTTYRLTIENGVPTPVRTTEDVVRFHLPASKIETTERARGYLWHARLDKE